MQHMTFLLLLMCLPPAPEWHSSTNPDNYETFVNTYFIGGREAFEVHVQEHLQYPIKSIQNCEVGEGIVEIEFGSAPKIKAVSFLNPLSKSLNLSIIETLKSTNEQWHPEVSGRILTMSFAFKIDEEMEVSGDILTSGVQLFAPGVPCRSDATILDLIHAKLAREQYRKALDHCLELVRRSPRNSEYQKLYRNIMDKLL